MVIFMLRHMATLALILLLSTPAQGLVPDDGNLETTSGDTPSGDAGSPHASAPPQQGCQDNGQTCTVTFHKGPTVTESAMPSGSDLDAVAAASQQIQTSAHDPTSMEALASLPGDAQAIEHAANQALKEVEPLGVDLQVSLAPDEMISAVNQLLVNTTDMVVEFVWRLFDSVLCDDPEAFGCLSLDELLEMAGGATCMALDQAIRVVDQAGAAALLGATFGTLEAALGETCQQHDETVPEEETAQPADTAEPQLTDWWYRDGSVTGYGTASNQQVPEKPVSSWPLALAGLALVALLAAVVVRHRK